MTKEIIDYYYKTKVYNIEYMVDLVDRGKITEEEFFEITRLSYKIIKREILH